MNETASSPGHRCMMIAVVLLALTMPAAQAHLMVAQHGTLNIVDTGAFMVLSLPVSAFPDVDDDDNGEISMIEFNRHRTDITGRIEREVVLEGQRGRCSLRALRLSPVIDRNTRGEALSQLVVMGRFVIDDHTGAFQLGFGLFGLEADEKTMQLTVTRPLDRYRKVLDVTPDARAHYIAAAWP